MNDMTTEFGPNAALKEQIILASRRLRSEEKSILNHIKSFNNRMKDIRHRTKADSDALCHRLEILVASCTVTDQAKSDVSSTTTVSMESVVNTGANNTTSTPSISSETTNSASSEQKVTANEAQKKLSAALEVLEKYSKQGNKNPSTESLIAEMKNYLPNKEPEAFVLKPVEITPDLVNGEIGEPGVGQMLMPTDSFTVAEVLRQDSCRIQATQNSQSSQSTVNTDAPPRSPSNQQSPRPVEKQ